jgi:hypothetical protein
MYKHNRHRGNTSRNRSHNTNLSIYGPQAGWLCYCDGDNGGGSSGGTTRCIGFARAMMMMSPLVMPFVWDVLFGMHLVNSQETDLSIYGPQAGWLHYCDGDNGGGG